MDRPAFSRSGRLCRPFPSLRGPSVLIGLSMAAVAAGCATTATGPGSGAPGASGPAGPVSASTGLRQPVPPPASDAGAGVAAPAAPKAADGDAGGADSVHALREALRTGKDLPQAIRRVEEAAAQGNADAAALLGTTLMSGRGGTVDQARAVQLFESSAAAGSDDGRIALATWLISGPAESRNLSRGRDLLDAVQGPRRQQALMLLSRLYGNPAFADRDPGKAFDYAVQSAEAGRAEAFGWVGHLMRNGTGVKKDDAIAYRWFDSGAARGDPYSTAMQAYLLLRGAGVAANVEEGERRLRAAASRRNGWAMGMLAVQYRDGQPLARNYALAYYWSSLGLHYRPGDNRFLVELRDEVEKKLTNQQIADTQRSVQLFRAPGATVGTPPGSPARPGGPARPARSGTAFYVSGGGHLMTNAHVVEGCRRVTTAAGGNVQVLRIDKPNDLAVLQAGKVGVGQVAGFRRQPVRVGEPVYVYGYPLTSLLTAEGSFASGVVAARRGLGDDPGRMQITAPIQSGNSGGPVFDRAGRVIGIVQSALNSAAVALLTRGPIPQNVNFAVHAEAARALLTGLSVQPTIKADGDLSPDLIAEAAKRMSVQVLCYTGVD